MPLVTAISGLADNRVSGLKRPRDRLLIALVRAHGQPRYDYPPKLVRYYKLDRVEAK